MPAPSSVPTWATDASFTSGLKAGSPTKVTPSAGAAAQGYVPDEPFKGEHSNWALNLLCGWAGWLSTINTQSDFLNRAFTWTGQHIFPSSLRVAYTPQLTTPVPFEEMLNLSLAQSNGGWGYSMSNGHLVSPTGSGYQVHIPIAIPSDNDLVNFKVGMRVGGGTATVSLLRFTPDESPAGGYSAPARTVLASRTQGAATEAEVTLASPIAHTISRSGNTGIGGWYVLEVVSGSSTDVIYYAKILHNMRYSGGRVSV